MRVTVLELITRALQEIRVLGADAQVDAADADLALRYFQGMVDLFQIDGFLTYAERRDDYLLVPGQRLYVVGPAGPDWVGPVPSQIASVSVIAAGDATGTELFLEGYSPDQWAQISTKTLDSDYPWVYYFQSATDETGEVYVWPVPTTNATLILRAVQPLQTPATLTTVLIFLPGYYEAWMLNLARRLVRPFAANEAPTLAEAANRALGTVKRMNDPGPPTQRSDAALLGGGSGSGSASGTGMLIARSASGNPPVWGQIIGQLSSQTDLQAALNGKVDLTGSYYDPAWVTALAASKITGTLTVAQGGIGLSTYTTGDLLVASDPTHLVALSTGPAGQVLTSMGVGAQPAWAPAAAVPWGSIWGLITNQGDLMAQFALKAPLDSPLFTGLPKAPTASPGTNTTQLATTAFVVTATSGSLAGLAPLNSPAFTGTPTAPTPPTNNNSNQLATTAYVQAQGYATLPIPESGVTNLVADLALKAPLASPALTGIPTAPTAAPGTSTTQLATTGYVTASLAVNVVGPGSSVVNDVATFADGSGKLVKDSGIAISSLALLASPAFTGVPTAPTAAIGTNTTQIATTAFVMSNGGGGSGGSPPPAGTGYAHVTGGIWDPAVLSIPQADVTNLTANLALKAPLASPALTGVPTAPTATAGTNTTQIATTAFVLANGGTGGSPPPAGTGYAHVTGGVYDAAVASIPEADVTSLVADLAARTVGPASALNNGIAIWSGTTGKILKDSAVLFASVAIKTSANVFTAANDFTGGSITAPTPLTADNSTTVATTAYVKAQGFALAGAAPAAHHTTHETGGADAIVALSGAVITTGTVVDARLSANVALENAANVFSAANDFTTGSITAPTQASADSSTKVATTAFVKAQGYAIAGAAPALHAATHKSGGTDVLALDTLGATTDITTLNASITAHGLLPKLSNVATQFLNGTGAWTVPPVGSGNVVGPASSVSSNVPIFADTTGKLLADSGKALPTGVVVGTTDTQTLSAKTLTTPTIASFVNATHNHQTAAGGGTLVEAALALTDLTTANASASAHGFLPKLAGNTTTFLRGDGTWVAPGGTGNVTGPASATLDALAAYNDTTGKVLRNSSLTVSTGGILQMQFAGGMRWVLTDTTQAAGGKNFGIVNSSQIGYFGAMDDAFTLISPLTIDRSGNVGIGGNLTITGTITVGSGSVGSVTCNTPTAGSTASNVANIWSVTRETAYAMDLTDGVTIALDATYGTMFRVMAAGDRTISVPTNPRNGKKIMIFHYASGAARTLTLSTAAGGFRFSTDIPALTQTVSGKYDVIGAVYNNWFSMWDVVAYVKGF